MRPINNVVDITNFVMLATGQPMHAFDFDLVAGGRLVVRRALDGETMTTLDDVERTFDDQVLIICDDDGPTSIAGIMGGERSEVRETTTRVLMEAATWNGPNIQRTSTRLALRSEASGRFEKGLQPEQAMDGQALATILMTELAGARLVDGTIDVGGPGPEPATIRLRDERMARAARHRDPARRGGRDPARARVRRRRGRRRARRHGAGVPAQRRHARGRPDRGGRAAVGAGEAPGHAARRGAAPPACSRPQQRLRRRAEDALAGAGLSEALRLEVRRARPRRPPARSRPTTAPASRCALRNPMSEDQSVLRTTLLGSLLDVARRNRARGMGDVRLFEIGAVFLAQPRSGEQTAAEQRGEALPEERNHIGALLTGAMRPPSWRESEPPRADFFTVKAVLAALLDTLRVPWSVEPAREPFLHPGRSARVLIGGEPAGWIGEIHPAVARAWDLERRRRLRARPRRDRARGAATVPRYEDVTSFPAVLQDRAWWFAPDVAAADVLATVREAGGALLRARRDLRRLSRRGPRVAGAAAASSAPTTARSPTRRSRSGARRSTPPWPSASGASRVGERSPSSARPATRARWRARCCTATRTSSSRT